MQESMRQLWMLHQVTDIQGVPDAAQVISSKIEVRQTQVVIGSWKR